MAGDVASRLVLWQPWKPLEERIRWGALEVALRWLWPAAVSCLPYLLTHPVSNNTTPNVSKFSAQRNTTRIGGHWLNYSELAVDILQNAEACALAVITHCSWNQLKTWTHNIRFNWESHGKSLTDHFLNCFVKSRWSRYGLTRNMTKDCFFLKFCKLTSHNRTKDFDI